MHLSQIVFLVTLLALPSERLHQQAPALHCLGSTHANSCAAKLPSLHPPSTEKSFFFFLSSGSTSTTLQRICCLHDVMPGYRSVDSGSIDLHPRAVASSSASQSSFIRPSFSYHVEGCYAKAKSLVRRYGMDVVSGVTAGVMMLPQGLAYASLANLPDVWGLYPGVIPALVYSAIGPCKQASVGPEALKSQLVGMVVLGLGDDSTLQEKIDEVLVLSFMFGMILFVLGLLRLGYVEALLSKAVVNGFIFAVAIEIAVEQLPSMLRIPPAHSSDGSIYRLFDILREAGTFKREPPFHPFARFERVALLGCITAQFGIFVGTGLLQAKIWKQMAGIHS